MPLCVKNEKTRCVEAVTPTLGSVANIVKEQNVRLTVNPHQTSQLPEQKRATDEKMFKKFTSHNRVSD